MIFAICLLAVGLMCAAASNNEEDMKNFCHYQGDVDLFIKKGEKTSIPNSCLEIECQRVGTILLRTCPAIPKVKDKKCKITAQDNSKLYPDCCPWLICE